MTSDSIMARRDAYRRAYTAYLSCVRALSNTIVQGERPSQELLDKERDSFEEVAAARAALLAELR